MTALKSITPTCGKGYVRLKKIEEGVVYYRYTKLRCKRWDCPECRAVKAKAVQAAIYRVMDKKKLWFATITDLHNTSLETAWATFGSRWNHLRTLLVREFGPMTYI
ncbi:MAG: hypothetical protein GY799_28110, partial [Desulfobulbaceae bacterium]|nr:hypothetical protein [Desulfobulbaceae bacterium]